MSEAGSEVFARPPRFQVQNREERQQLGALHCHVVTSKLVYNLTVRQERSVLLSRAACAKCVCKRSWCGLCTGGGHAATLAAGQIAQT